MTRQLPADCLNEIFEILNDNVALHSCLLVNRLWCEVSVRILWRRIWNYSTLIDCLPKESKETLYNNEIIINPSLKPPLFNYVSFLRYLSIDKFVRIFINHHPLASQYLIDNKLVVIIQEIFKMFISRISSVKKLMIRSIDIPNFTFYSYPGAIDCLTNLSEFDCGSDIRSEFFYQLSRICHNVQSLSITLKSDISDGLADLISVQQNLKIIIIHQSYTCNSDYLKWLIPFVAKHSNTLTKVDINGVIEASLLFLVNCENLQVLLLNSFKDSFKDFKRLQHVVFPQLRELQLNNQHIKPAYVIKFLENNGNYLEKYYGLYNYNNSINVAIGKFCSNLKFFCVTLKRNEMEGFKVILNNCHRLEGIEVWCGSDYLNEIELLEVVVKYSPKTFYNLSLFYTSKSLSNLLSKGLESFFTSWKDRTPQKSLNFSFKNMYAANNLDFKNENMNMFEKICKVRCY
ncbi:5809_t:CDS:1 [Funneliformis caledonium]|uniref:5809_t:CDS:1 n=1 Tax=Funneliformis caledonium TaxID=1117310 RepID=A0A9N9FCJ1_9GLOM|nr:5809_t:CDS:1 [Funneliformis caledonium]